MKGSELEKKWQWSSHLYIPYDFRKIDTQIGVGIFPENDGITDDGIYIDDVRICSIPGNTNFYSYRTGTSMATPMVTGVAGLVWAKYPNLTYLDIKRRILNNADVVPQLQGKVATSGRINAYKALTGCVSTFWDVSCNNWALNYIQAIYNAGITKGCGEGKYCPNDPVTRASMAAFIVRAKYGDDPLCQNGTTPCQSTAPYFKDVSPSDWYYKYVQKMKEEGITQGCGGGDYCPNFEVTRDQMAAFIVRAKVGENFDHSPTPYFTDVSSIHWAFKYIQKLRELGITQGYPDGTYRPNNIVTRAEMAAFLARGFLSMQ